MGKLALNVLLAHWRESLIVALMLAATGLYVQREHALVGRGIALERARLADSMLVVNAGQLAHVDTLYRRDTLRLTRSIARVDSLRDTLLVHLTDTVRVKEYVTRTDSALKACTELADDCAAFRQLATQRFAAYEAKLAAQPIATPARSCTVSNLVWGGIGVVGAAAIARLRPP